MDIKEVWTEFKDRITSPYFGSFIISWVAINWRIPVVLFFYKYDDLKTGKTTYIDFIQRHSNLVNTLIWPGVIALIYTFGYPWFKRLVTVYIARQTAITDRELLKVNDTTSVSMDKFLDTKANLKKKETDLQAIINEEGKTRAENTSLNSEVVMLQAEITSLKQTHHDAIVEINRIDVERTNDLLVEKEEQRRTMIEDCSSRVKQAQESSNEQVRNMQIDISEKDKVLELQRGIIANHERKAIVLDREVEELRSNLKDALDHEVSLKNDYDVQQEFILQLKAQLDVANNSLSSNAIECKKIVKSYRDILVETLPILRKLAAGRSSRGTMPVEQIFELDNLIDKLQLSVGQKPK